MPVKDVTSRYPIAIAWPRLLYGAGKVDAIAIHHSVTPTPSATATEADELAILDAIHRYHVSRGFGGIGYHLCVFPSGRVYLVSRLSQWGANVGRNNNHIRGICFIGTFVDILPSSQHLIAGAEAVFYIDVYEKARDLCSPHSKWTSTACPSRVAEKVLLLNGRSLYPPDVSDPIWNMIRAITKKGVMLYRDVDLVSLATKKPIKRLPAGTGISVSGIYSGTHYLSTWSMTNRKPNGFEIAATVKPPVETCVGEKAEILRLQTLQKALVERNTRLTNDLTASEGDVDALQAIVNEVNRLTGR